MRWKHRAVRDYDAHRYPVFAPLHAEEALEYSHLEAVGECESREEARMLAEEMNLIHEVLES